MKPYPEAPEGLIVEQDGGVLQLIIDRPERRNSLTDPIVYALIGTLESAASDESVRVIHLTGTGDHFCSGFDLGERVNGPEKPRVGSIHRRMNGHVNRLIPMMLSTQIPIVCTARGWAIGLGLDLLLASDFAIVADNSRLWAPFTTFGFTPDSGASWLIPRLAGVARAREMLMLGKKVTGLEAASWGMVHRSVSETAIATVSDQLLAELSAAPTVAVGLTKMLINNAMSATIDQHLVEEGFAMEISSRSEDFKEYSKAARDKRPPEFTGR